jgi:hypothetical protein
MSSDPSAAAAAVPVTSSPRVLLTVALAFVAGAAVTTVVSPAQFAPSALHGILGVASSPHDDPSGLRGGGKTRRKSSTCTEPFIPPIPCRDDIVRAVAEAGAFKTGYAAEVGVFQGEFSAKNMPVFVSGGGKTYFMIDAWQFRAGESGPNDKNFEDDLTNNANFEAAEKATMQWADQRSLIRGFSVPSATQFPNASFDWVYLDALHTYSAVVEDIEAWYPKVRPGGILSGDDYGDMKDTPMMPAARVNRIYGVIPSAYEWGVIRAVQEFGKRIGVQVHVTYSQDCYQYPAWYIIKPCDAE